MVYSISLQCGKLSHCSNESKLRASKSVKLIHERENSSREAATHPTINRAAGYDQNNPRDQVLERVAVEAPLDRPTEAWRTAFLLKFQGLREVRPLS